MLPREEDHALEPLLSTSHSHWIGLSDYAKEGNKKFIKLMILHKNRFLGTYVWQESHQVAEYQNWNSGEPDNGNIINDEDCVVKGGMLYQ